MSLPIISADQRLQEKRGIKGCIFGKIGLGKTTLLWTLDANSTLFLIWRQVIWQLKDGLEILFDLRRGKSVEILPVL